MAKDNRHPVKQRKCLKNLILAALVLFIFIGIPFLLIGYQAKQKGMTRSEVIKRIMNKSGGTDNVSGEITANSPTHLLTLELGDFNNDGLMDMVTGGMHAYPPYDRMSRISLWINNGKLAGKKSN